MGVHEDGRWNIHTFLEGGNEWLSSSENKYSYCVTPQYSMNASQRKEKLHLSKHLHTHIHSIRYWRIHQWIFKTLVYTYWISTQPSKRNELARCGDACLLAQPQRGRQMTTYTIQEDPVSRAKQNKWNWLDTSLQESPVSFSCFWSHSPPEPTTHHTHLHSALEVTQDLTIPTTGSL